MQKFLTILVFIIFACLATRVDSLGSRADMMGASSPYYLAPGNGMPASVNAADPLGGFFDATGRTYVSLGSLSGTKALIITTWQSNIENAALGTFTPTNKTALNFSLCDRGVYRCANPVLGTSQNNTSLGSNSANCQIADSLITAGTYADVIMAPMAIGGTLCSEWAAGGDMNQRIVVLMNALKARGLTPATGFVGDVWVVAHGGETDAISSPVEATLATCIRAFAQAFTNNGLTNFRFFVSTESMVSNSTNAIVTAAQADAVASGCSTCRAGSNVDSLTQTAKPPPMAGRKQEVLQLQE